jgi:hypothetical protein
MPTIRIRSAAWFASGIAISLIIAATFLSVRSFAAPGPDETTFVPITPCRLFDYRPAPNTVGTRTSPLGPAEVHTQQVTGTVGNCTIPTDATGIALNVTATGATAQTNIRLYPADVTTPPIVSNLNVSAGQPAVPNKVDVKLSPNGAVNVRNQNGTVYVLGDAVGYYTPNGLADLQAQLDSTIANLIGVREQANDLASQLDGQRTVTVTYSGLDMKPAYLDDPALLFSAGCHSILNGNDGLLPLRLPVGTTILEVTARILDDPSYPAFSIQLDRFAPASTGTIQTILTSAGRGTLPSVVPVVRTRDLTPPAEVVDPDETFRIFFRDGTVAAGAAGNGLCSVSVTYRRPSS